VLKNLESARKLPSFINQ